jgi:hypothetical protein
MRSLLSCLLFVLVLGACKSSKKNCDCPSFPTKKPRRWSQNSLPSGKYVQKEYLIYGICKQWTT